MNTRGSSVLSFLLLLFGAGSLLIFLPFSLLLLLLVEPVFFYFRFFFFTENKSLNPLGTLALISLLPYFSYLFSTFSR